MQRSMQRLIPVLTLLLIVQLGLATALAVRKDPLAATTPDTPLVGAPVQSADHVIIEGNTADGGSPGKIRVELAKQNGKWILPGYFNAPANSSKLTAVLGTLASLKRGLPIATSSTALKRFQVADDDFQRRLVLSETGKTLSTVYFGGSPGARKSDARTAKDHAVYAVDLATYELPTQNSEWFDGDLLQRDPASVTELDITTSTSAANLKLVRQSKAVTSATPAESADTWIDASLPAGKQIDGAHADALAHQIAALHVDAVLGLEPKPEWQQQHPILTLGIVDQKHPGQSMTWTLSKPSDDYYVLKSSAQPWYFRVNSAAGKQLLDASSTGALTVVSGPQRKGSVNARPSLKKAARAEEAEHIGKAAGATKAALGA